MYLVCLRLLDERKERPCGRAQLKWWSENERSKWAQIRLFCCLMQMNKTINCVHFCRCLCGLSSLRLLYMMIRSFSLLCHTHTNMSPHARGGQTKAACHDYVHVCMFVHTCIEIQFCMHEIILYRNKIERHTANRAGERK